MGFHPCLANSLQAKLNPVAGLDVRQDERHVFPPVPYRHLLYDVVCSIKVECSEEKEGKFVVLRGGPGQRYAAAVP